MKKVLWLIGLSFIFGGASVGQTPVLKYTTGDWNPDLLGNHRVMIRVEKKAEAVLVEIPWRRRDFHPDKKEILVCAGNDTVPIDNRLIREVNRESGTVIFEPVAGPGTYYLYYLPYNSTGRNYPTVTYVEPSDRANPEWKERTLMNLSSIPKARAIGMQAIAPLHSFYPMEVIATATEVKQLLASRPSATQLPYRLFPEVRDYPIKMWTDLPHRWVKNGLGGVLADTVQPNEYLAFQVGVYAVERVIPDLNITYSDLLAKNGKRITASHFTCFNKEGNGWNQQSMVKVIQIPMGKVQPLWFGLDIPPGTSPATYRGTVTIHPNGMEPQSIQLQVTVKGALLADRGDSEPWRHSRLRWLNSDIAVDDQVIPPYTPVQVEGNTLRILGREVVLSPGGLPGQIHSYFAPEMTRLSNHPLKLLAGPIQFTVDQGPQLTGIKTSGIEITLKSEGAVEWISGFQIMGIRFKVKGRLEFDGMLTYNILAIAEQEVSVRDIYLTIPMNGNSVEYMLGLGRVGGFAPDRFTWLWDPYFNCDGPWLGTINGGLQATFRAENYERPLNTNFYQQKPLHMPPSWFNEGKGGIALTRTDEEYALKAFSGNRTLQPGESLHFNMHLLITPFRPIDTRKQWNDRYYHSFKPLDTIAAIGANTINVHHATEINPFINYPFITPEAMKEYIDAAHQRDYKVKIYYTVRELSNICPEIWALKSLGNEILSYGSGGGYSWLQEHLDENYIAAWFVPELKDAAVINSGVSRWHNYYLEGLDWLVRNVGIDGLYIDDVAFDRSIMQRVRKILERGNSSPRIDLHSANQFNPRDGFVNSANLYLEHFPYLDRLWFGEYFDYNAGPEYWMTEVSGLPFGLMGEMLQDGGNRWRGMLYGMTARAPWSGDPTPLWKLWDEFGIGESEMIGYWVKSCPVKTGRDDVLATVYKKEGSTMVALASWAAGPARVKLDIDWKALGIDPVTARLHLPAVKDFQEEGSIDPQKSFQVEAGKGFLLIIENR